MARTSYAQVKHRRCAVAGVDLETHGSDVIDLTVEFLRGAGCEVH